MHYVLVTSISTAAATPDVDRTNTMAVLPVDFMTKLPSDPEATAAESIPSMAQARLHAREHYEAGLLQWRSGNRELVRTL